MEKFFLSLTVNNEANVLKNTVMSIGCSNYRFTGTAIAFMSDKKGRGNGDNSRDHSSHEPFETSCTARSPYLRHTHLPDRVSGYRKRFSEKIIGLPLKSEDSDPTLRYGSIIMSLCEPVLLSFGLSDFGWMSPSPSTRDYGRITK